jgi:hypothetical protein
MKAPDVFVVEDDESGEAYVSPPGARRGKDGFWRKAGAPSAVEFMEKFSLVTDEARATKLSQEAAASVSVA